MLCFYLRWLAKGIYHRCEILTVLLVISQIKQPFMKEVCILQVCVFGSMFSPLCLPDRRVPRCVLMPLLSRMVKFPGSFCVSSEFWFWLCHSFGFCNDTLVLTHACHRPLVYLWCSWHWTWHHQSRVIFNNCILVFFPAVLHLQNSSSLFQFIRYSC